MSADLATARGATAPVTAPALAALPARTTGMRRLAAVARVIGTVALLTTSAAATGWLVGGAVSAAAADRAASWVVGRAAGIASYLLLVALVALGLLLAHPWRHRVARPRTPTRIRVHVGLAAFTGCLTVLHVVVLATDRYAGVGWAGALLPWGSAYRPAAVTLGVLGLWCGLAAGTTAALAGRWAGRAWRPIHHVAVVAMVLVWAHGVLAGSDTRALLALYVVTGLGLVALAVHRHTARPPLRRDAGARGAAS